MHVQNALNLTYVKLVNKKFLMNMIY